MLTKYRFMVSISVLGPFARRHGLHCRVLVGVLRAIIPFIYTYLSPLASHGPGRPGLSAQIRAFALYPGHTHPLLLVLNVCFANLLNHCGFHDRECFAVFYCSSFYIWLVLLFIRWDVTLRISLVSMDQGGCAERYLAVYFCVVE